MCGLCDNGKANWGSCFLCQIGGFFFHCLAIFVYVLLSIVEFSCGKENLCLNFK